MRIRGWNIEGFGVFRDYELPCLAPGLNVFLGPNEAGKSTLLAFLRGMLFGIPSADHFPPLHGGEHGGQIILESPEGPVRVERRSGPQGELRLTRESGESLPPEALESWLGAVDEGIFSSVFAFGLGELQRLDSLSRPDLEQYLHSAALAGTARSAGRVARELRSRADALRPGTPGSRSAVFRSRIEQLDRRLESTRRRLATYGDLRTEEAAARKALEATDEEIHRQQRRLARRELRLELWPIWCDVERSRRELGATEVIDAFPEDAEARLVGSRERARAAREEAGTLHSQYAGALARREEIAARLDDDLRDLSGEIHLLADSIATYHDSLRQRDAAAALLEERRSELRSQLDEVAPGWSADRLDAFDPESRLRPELARWRERLDRCSRELAETRASYHARAAAVRRLSEDRLRRALDLAGRRPVTDASIARSRRALDQLRSCSAERPELSGALATAEARREDLRRRVGELERAEPPSRPRVLYPAAVGLAAIAGASAVTAAIGASPVWAVPFSLLAVMGLAAALLARAAVRRTEREQAALRQERVALREELTLADRDVRRQEARWRALLAREDSLARTLSISGRVDGQALAEAERRLRRDEEHRERREEERERLARETRALETEREEEDRLASCVSQAASQCSEAAAGLVSWSKQAGIPTTPSPSALGSFLDRVDIAREARRAVREAESDAEAAEGRVLAWEDRAVGLLRRLGNPEASSADDLPRGVLDARERSDRDHDLRLRLKAFDEELETRRTASEVSERRARAAEAEHRSLLAEGGATDEETFLRRLATFRRRRELTRTIHREEMRLAARIDGGASHHDEVIAWLRRGEPDRWQREAGQLREQIEGLGRRRDEAVRRHRDAELAVASLERSSDLAALRTERGALAVEWRREVDRWRTVALAAEILDRARVRYEREHQPAVLVAASEVFRVVTEDRYTRVFQARRAGDLRIEAADGTTKRPGELSRGTAEQLYLALRLALVRHYASEGTRLPLVLDDILVNFDPRRARAAARAIVDLARTEQVLLLTCQPTTIERLEEAGGSAPVHPLGFPPPEQ